MKRQIWIGVAVVIVVAIGTLLVFRPWSSPESTSEQQTERAAVSVRTVEAERGSVRAWVFAEGTARSVQREYLTFENSGKIVYIATGPDGEELREGDPVTVGTVLARQDQRQYEAAVQTAQASVREARTQLVVAQTELEQARTEAELARATFARFETLLGQNSAAQQEYDEAKAQSAKADADVARAQSRIEAAESQIESAEAKVVQEQVDLEKTEIIAPIDGIVAYLNIEEGYYFTPSNIRTDEETAALQTVPVVVIDPTRFEVTVDIPSFDRQRVRAGQSVLIVKSAETVEEMVRATTRGDEPSGQIARLPETPVLGEVYSVNPAITPGARSVRLRVRTTQNGDRLEDGEFVTLWIATEERTDVVIAPLNVFIYRDNEPFVFVVDPTDRSAEQRSVTLGLQGLGVQEIVSGVSAGERLVTNGRFGLSDGARVRDIGISSGNTSKPTAEGTDND
jgi:RND family efflux transporter MFP subunit